jgi:hypothetical protein
MLLLRINQNMEGGGLSGAAPGPIVIVFNNARPTEHSTGGESYRAVLHAAIMLDDAKSW